MSHVNDSITKELADATARIAVLEAEIQQLKKEIQLLLTGSTEFVDKEG